MTTMFAVTTDGQDGFATTTVPRPSAGPTEVLIRVEAAGINPADWKSRDAPPLGSDSPPDPAEHRDHGARRRYRRPVTRATTRNRSPRFAWNTSTQRRRSIPHTHRPSRSHCRRPRFNRSSVRTCSPSAIGGEGSAQPPDRQHRRARCRRSRRRRRSGRSRQADGQPQQ